MRTFGIVLLAGIGLARAAHGGDLDVVAVEGQPLASAARRLLDTLKMLGAPLAADAARDLEAAIQALDPAAIQRALDPHVLLEVSINPESRVKAARGPAKAVLQQSGFVPVLVKVRNEAALTKRLRVSSPQAGPVYAGVARLSMERQDQLGLIDGQNARRDPDRFLHLEVFEKPPMAAGLSGLAVEYAVLLLYSSEPGKREAVIAFDVGQGSQDLGFRGEAAVLFDVRPAIPVDLSIRDERGVPSVARLTVRDAAGRVHPPQPKRLAPDFFFQEHVYRRDGGVLLLAPGAYTLEATRGPEYRTLTLPIQVPHGGRGRAEVRLARWIDPAAHGFYSGDHHIHAAGCAHYESPTQGVAPEDMLLQVKGEGLNVGCVLTWGPCFDFQRGYFSPEADRLSEPFTVLKYDLEISGFGSQALGHVCLLGLKDQTYPGSDGTKGKGWPTWTAPVLRWAKAQGAVTGYAHSASGLEVDPPAAAKRLVEELDSDGDRRVSRAEADAGLLPERFDDSDQDRDGFLAEGELARSADRAAERLPNFAVPEMDGVGAMEIPVTAVLGACDFVSAMDTPRIAEWSCWYHLLDCGLPVKVSGETDFPCMSSTRVGQGRVYVRLGKVDRVDFRAWCEGIAKGRSYVSDGFAHALEFSVGGKSFGEELRLDAPGVVEVRATVAFAPETPLSPAQGLVLPPKGKRALGDTVVLHGPRPRDVARGGMRLVEVVVNGRPAASAEVPADGAPHELSFKIGVERSSWIALRQFPQLHTNPVNVIVGGKPIRASRRSALWCVKAIEQLWRKRGSAISESERADARRAFDEAIEAYRRIASESPEDR